jgi:hypothetical protein
MARHNTQCKPGGIVVSIKGPDAKDVFVAGTFNNWDKRSNRLKRSTKDGQWVATLCLPPGRYEHKFIVDGEWCCELGCDQEYSGCPGCVPNGFGTMNRLLLVELPDQEGLPASGKQL